MSNANVDPSLGTLALTAACSKSTTVRQNDWPVVPDSSLARVRTKNGVEYELRKLEFATTGLLGVGRQLSPGGSTDTVTLRIPLDSIEVVRVRELDKKATACRANGRGQSRSLPARSAVDEIGEDVLERLIRRDGRYFMALQGSRVSLEFAEPPRPEGVSRSVFAQTTGHYYFSTDDHSPRQSRGRHAHHVGPGIRTAIFHRSPELCRSPLRWWVVN